MEEGTKVLRKQRDARIVCMHALHLPETADGDYMDATRDLS